CCAGGWPKEQRAHCPHTDTVQAGSSRNDVGSHVLGVGRWKTPSSDLSARERASMPVHFRLPRSRAVRPRTRPRVLAKRTNRNPCDLAERFAETSCSTKSLSVRGPGVRNPRSSRRSIVSRPVLRRGSGTHRGRVIPRDRYTEG